MDSARSKIESGEVPNKSEDSCGRWLNCDASCVYDKVNVCLTDGKRKSWAVGSVVRASVSHTEGHRFKSCTAHHKIRREENGI